MNDDEQKCSDYSHYFKNIDNGCMCGAYTNDCGVIKGRPVKEIVNPSVPIKILSDEDVSSVLAEISWDTDIRDKIEHLHKMKIYFIRVKND